MGQELLSWDIYEITTDGKPVNGVKLRGRIRKLGLEKEFNVLAENTSDVKNGVRFAVLNSKDAAQVSGYVHTIISGASIKLVRESVPNPVLSKLPVNLTERYEL